VKVHYILTSSLGDTIQSSYQGDGKGNVEPVPLALNGGVIPGWSFAIPKMKVGGKYRIYIPWNLAYGEQQGKESLCFMVELLERGAEGSFTKSLKTNP
jgi:FKBP-type peptidyl-prolyl cis-trans isomerase FklB